MKTKEFARWLQLDGGDVNRIQHLLKTQEDQFELEPEVENLPKEEEDPYRKLFQLKPESDREHFIGSEYFLG